MDTVTHFYLRRIDINGGIHRFGCVAMRKARSLNGEKRIAIAVSVCNPSDKFIAKVACHKALGRLKSESFTKIVPVSGDIDKVLLEFDKRLVSKIDAARDIDWNATQAAYEGALKNLEPIAKRKAAR